VLNSRGAIARFDRGSIEIRVLDAQEAPVMDCGILELVVAVLRDLADERWSSIGQQQAWPESRLVPLLDATIDMADHALVSDSSFLAAFGVRAAERTAAQTWASLADEVGHRLSDDGGRAVESILARGTLASRITAALGRTHDRKRLRNVYSALAACLENNEPFIPESPPRSPEE
jgi:carboxylate-amine ligase